MKERCKPDRSGTFACLRVKAQAVLAALASERQVSAQQKSELTCAHKGLERYREDSKEQLQQLQREHRAALALQGKELKLASDAALSSVRKQFDVRAWLELFVCKFLLRNCAA